MVYYCSVSVYCACLVILIFFFFKQKTAYEMRSSDWSSDVCSSDLARRGRRSPGHAVERPFVTMAPGLRKFMLTVHLVTSVGWIGAEIGRASCRERVCQSV